MRDEVEGRGVPGRLRICFHYNSTNTSQEGVVRAERLRGRDECSEADLQAPAPCCSLNAFWMATVCQAVFSVVFEVTFFCQQIGVSLICSVRQEFGPIECDTLQPVKEISMSNIALMWILASLTSCTVLST